ncbi:MAG: hypothetical protein IPK20_00515 [Betaproteobacteria bacterium]|nr:hypothetical protein [Betaproteobacteria bacterium]
MTRQLRMILTMAWLWALAAQCLAADPDRAAVRHVAVLDFQDGASGKATPAEILSLSDLVRGVARAPTA